MLKNKNIHDSILKLLYLFMNQILGSEYYPLIVYPDV